MSVRMHVCVNNRVPFSTYNPRLNLSRDCEIRYVCPKPLDHQGAWMLTHNLVYRDIRVISTRHDEEIKINGILLPTNRYYTLPKVNRVESNDYSPSKTNWVMAQQQYARALKKNKINKNKNRRVTKTKMCNNFSAALLS
jgi:hypothetical protein